MRNILGSPYLSVIPTHIINNSPFNFTNIIIPNLNSNPIHPPFLPIVIPGLTGDLISKAVSPITDVAQESYWVEDYV